MSLAVSFHLCIAFEVILLPIAVERHWFGLTEIRILVTFDCTLSFSKHVSSPKATFFPHIKALRCISAFSWVQFKESLSLLYKAFFGPFSLMVRPDGFLFVGVTFDRTFFFPKPVSSLKAKKTQGLTLYLCFFLGPI